MRALREASGLTGDSVARRASMSAGKLPKIETGKVRPTVQDVDLVLTAVGVSQVEVPTNSGESQRRPLTPALADTRPPDRTSRRRCSGPSTPRRHQ
ncbi:helix-turn-helix domain-containing protein [Streptomyces syringium]|uniref:helix-turn-helix domain-containing protein n=1 Tax=Streptomyces syringium TaxID=76729 RepID=UPI0034443AAC